MKLPNAQHVRVDSHKVLGYLLSRTHPVGRFKAQVFAALGFGEQTADAFASELRRIAADGDVSETEDTKFGRKYTVPGTLAGPAGSREVLTVWIHEHGSPEVRLVTVKPRKS